MRWGSSRDVVCGRWSFLIVASNCCVNCDWGSWQWVLMENDGTVFEGDPVGHFNLFCNNDKGGGVDYCLHRTMYLTKEGKSAKQENQNFLLHVQLLAFFLDLGLVLFSGSATSFCLSFLGPPPTREPYPPK